MLLITLISCKYICGIIMICPVVYVVNIFVVKCMGSVSSVSTIPEETEDQMGRVDKKLHLQQEPLVELCENDVLASTRSEPVMLARKSETVPKLDLKTGSIKTAGQKSVTDSQKGHVAPSEVKSENDVIKRSVPKSDQGKVADTKVDGDSAYDKVISNATNNTSVKTNIEVSSLSPRTVTKPPSEHNSQKVSPKGQQNGLRSTVGSSQKVVIPPLVKVSEKSVKCDQTEYQSPRIHRKDKDTERTQTKEHSSPLPVKLPGAIVGRNFEDTSNAGQHRRQVTQAPQRGVRGQTPNALIVKEVATRGDDGKRRNKAASTKMKPNVKFPPLLNVATGGRERRRKSTSGSRHSDRPKTRDSLISVPFDPSLIDYSDDFDDSSDSDVDEG